MTWIVTGAAGFIGTNLCIELMKLGRDVVLIDDLSRANVHDNAEFLKSKFGLQVTVIDVSDWEELKECLEKIENIEVLIHLAGQVSFMASVSDPRRDFEVNALGTLNILEYVRIYSPKTVVIGMSSNKIYGSLSGIRVFESEKRYFAPDFPLGFNESLKIDFHGPYGCSKGAADQYLRDYNRIYGLRTMSFRQSSVYGKFQKPASDQGWLSFFLREAQLGKEINLNGKGKQVRDLLYVDDLVKLFLCVSDMPFENYGHSVNVGGGALNSLSILELFEILEEMLGVEISYKFGQERPSDQKVFISDNTLIQGLVNWRPSVSVEQGLGRLMEADGSH